ncbi:MAG: hypothetical protein J3Q66DRAFT_436113, partial [Benniella sp.]
MLFRSIVPSPKNSLLPHQILGLTNVFLENAFKSSDHDIALVLCHHAEAALTQMKDITKVKSSTAPEHRALHEGIAKAYYDLGRLLDGQRHRDEAQVFFKKSEKW